MNISFDDNGAGVGVSVGVEVGMGVGVGVLVGGGVGVSEGAVVAVRVWLGVIVGVSAGSCKPAQADTSEINPTTWMNRIKCFMAAPRLKLTSLTGRDYLQYKCKV